MGGFLIGLGMGVAVTLLGGWGVKWLRENYISSFLFALRAVLCHDQKQRDLISGTHCFEVLDLKPLGVSHRVRLATHPRIGMFLLMRYPAYKARVKRSLDPDSRWEDRIFISMDGLTLRDRVHSRGLDGSGEVALVKKV